MREYDFYYDESYQCRAITYKNHTNIEINNSDAEFYIGCFIGSTDWESLIPRLISLESRYKEEQGINDDVEIKSHHLLKPQNLKYGIASLPDHTILFYSNLFRILDNNVKIHINVLNKYEEIVKEIFPSSDWFDRNCYLYKPFIYSMTKFLSHHQNKYDILSIFYSYKNNKWKIKQLIAIFEKHRNSIKNLEKKQEEINIMQLFIKIMSNNTFYLRSIKHNLRWDYDKIATIFANYCASIPLLIRNISIDREENTLRSMKKFFPKAVGLESSEHIQIRVCDWVVGFIGRLMLSYYNQLRSNNIYEFTNQLSMLKPECFILRLNQKEIILQMYKLFLEQQESYWSTTTSIYSDYTMVLYTMIRYCQDCIVHNINMNNIDFNESLITEYKNVLHLNKKSWNGSRLSTSQEKH